MLDGEGAEEGVKEDATEEAEAEDTVAFRRACMYCRTARKLRWYAR
ncbi:hypothetical protein FACS189472_18950 [Alphaproteobacteria bacterium]|nr:hypothetical protein FACS189472_18950 [Alphaproteobacteria bacterium]